MWRSKLGRSIPKKRSRSKQMAMVLKIVGKCQHRAHPFELMITGATTKDTAHIHLFSARDAWYATCARLRHHAIIDGDVIPNRDVQRLHGHDQNHGLIPTKIRARCCAAFRNHGHMHPGVCAPAPGETRISTNPFERDRCKSAPQQRCPEPIDVSEVSRGDVGESQMGENGKHADESSRAIERGRLNYRACLDLSRDH